MPQSPQWPPAFCPVHGLFPATNTILVEGNARYELTGMVTNCRHPGCNQTAEIIPGKYSALPGRLNILVDPTISTEALAAIKDIAERLKREEISPEEAHAQAKRFGDKVGKLFSPTLLRSSGAVGFLTAVIAICSSPIIQSGINAYSSIRAAEIQAEAQVTSAEIQAKATIKAAEIQSGISRDDTRSETVSTPKGKPNALKRKLLNSTTFADVPPMPRRKPAPD